MKYIHISTLERGGDSLGLDGSHGLVAHALGDGIEQIGVDVEFRQVGELRNLLGRRSIGSLGHFSSGFTTVGSVYRSKSAQWGNGTGERGNDLASGDREG